VIVKVIRLLQAFSNGTWYSCVAVDKNFNSLAPRRAVARRLYPFCIDNIVLITRYCAVSYCPTFLEKKMNLNFQLGYNRPTLCYRAIYRSFHRIRTSRCHISANVGYKLSELRCTCTSVPLMANPTYTREHKSDSKLNCVNCSV